LNDKDLKRNKEGYYDPTAYEAIKNVEAEEKSKLNDNDYERFQKFIGCIFRICELSDFHIEERLVIKDKRTGKIWS
jgi:hypothetical protein